MTLRWKCGKLEVWGNLFFYDVGTRSLSWGNFFPTSTFQGEKGKTPQGKPQNTAPLEKYHHQINMGIRTNFDTQNTLKKKEREGPFPPNEVKKRKGMGSVFPLSPYLSLSLPIFSLSQDKDQFSREVSLKMLLLEVFFVFTVLFSMLLQWRSFWAGKCM